MISSKTATTGDDGRYQIPALPPGNYKVVIDAGGFAKFESGAVGVNRGSNVNRRRNVATGVLDQRG